MKNRLVQPISLLLLVIMLSLCFAACGHEHTYGEWETKQAATCTNVGEEIRTCECGEKESKTIPATGHTDGEWITDSNATCVAAGSKHQVCSVCNTTIKTETIAATGSHNYTGQVTTEATCAHDGVTKYTCTSCSASYSENFSYPSFTATEIYNNYLNSVGEIITYDKSGNEYALGSCFVYTADGKVITNYHVIEDGYSAKITFGSETYEVQKVLAYDKDIDIAVLKVSATGLQPVQICTNSHSVGQVVYAFGNSKGLTSTFSDGMITYSNREMDGVSYVQHDAPISSGNSGGPLINIYGEVIGINTWTVRDSQNLNFAITVNELDHLDYSTPLTMAQFYEKECNVFVRLKNYIIANGTYNSSNNYYSMTFGNSYSSDYSSKYTRKAYYYVDDNEITLDLLIDDGDYWVYFTIDENMDGSYFWAYFDDNDYKMSGTLYATTFDEDTLLGYSYNNISVSSLRTSIRKLASSMMQMICICIDTDLSDAGVSAADLYFYCF